MPAERGCVKIELRVPEGKRLSKRSVAAAQGRSPYLSLFLLVTIILGSLFTAWLIVEPGKLNTTLVGAGMGALIVAASPFYVVLAEVLLLPLDWLPAWGPLYLLGLLAFVSMGLAIGIKAARKQRFVSPLQWVMLAFVFVATLSALASQPRHTALRTVMPLFQAFALAYSFEAFINTRARLVLVSWLLVVIAAIQALMCVVQPVLGPIAYLQRHLPTAEGVPWGYYFGPIPRAFGTFKHPAGAAFLIALGLFLLLGLLLIGRKRMPIWGFAIAVVMVMGLLATFARAQIFFTAPGLLWLLWHYSGKSFGKLLGAYLALIILGALAFYLLPQDYRTATGHRINAAFSPTSEHYRLSVNQQTWLVFLSHPLLGLGYGNVRWQLGEYASEAGASEVGGEPHNLFLALGADLGLVGLGLFVLLIWYAHIQFGKAINHCKHASPELVGICYAFRLNLWLWVAAWLIGGSLGYPTVFLPFAWSAVCLQVAERSRILVEASSNEGAKRYQ